MNRVRARLAKWTPLALTVFCASIASPRAGLYFHHHADGDHVHVHADEDDEHGADHDDDLDEPHHHHHDDHLAAGDHQQPEIEAPDHDETGHWHSQDRFHRALGPTLTVGEGAELIAIVEVTTESRCVDRDTVPTRARGPPPAS